MEYRELLPEEFHLAPREVEGSEVFTPENSRILAAFNENGEIVSTWVLFAMMHCEPFWIRPDYRGNPSIVKNMSILMDSTLRASGIREAYTIVLNNIHAKVLTRLARWFGFSVMDGTLLKWRRDGQ
jgi:hypothetical protein